MCMSFVAVGRSLAIFSYVAFKRAVLYFERCSIAIHPLPFATLSYGAPGGILVDHWSTISSFVCRWSGTDIVCTVLTYHTVKSLNISRTLKGNKIVDHSDVVGAAPVGAAPTTSSFSTSHVDSMDWATARRDKKRLCLGIGRVLY